MTTRTHEYDFLEPLLVEHAALPPGDPRRAALRDRLVAGYLPIARNIAARFARRGEPLDDLEQVASIGLLGALERFEPSRGSNFLSYAIPTVTGEVRRHFRDRTWSIRTPRGVKDRFVAIGTATSAMSQDLGRAPTAAELAHHLGIDMDAVLEALAAHSAHQAGSLDQARSVHGDLLGVLADVDPAFERVEARSVLATLVGVLPEREQRILVLRFVHEWTQKEIALDIGISQMHVSRLLSRTLDVLRAEAEQQEEAVAAVEIHERRSARAYAGRTPARSGYSEERRVS